LHLVGVLLDVMVFALCVTVPAVEAARCVAGGASGRQGGGRVVAVPRRLLTLESWLFVTLGNQVHHLIIPQHSINSSQSDDVNVSVRARVC
jgi:hypothetical protein